MIYHSNMTDTINGRIKHLRTTRGDSIPELADYLGVSIKVIYNIESGLNLPAIDTLIKLSNKYGVSIDYICKGFERGNVK